MQTNRNTEKQDDRNLPNPDSSTEIENKKNLPVLHPFLIGT